MLRLRHTSQINGAETNEIVLLNSHDGASSYQMLACMFRLAPLFYCSVLAERDGQLIINSASKSARLRVTPAMAAIFDRAYPTLEQSLPRWTIIEISILLKYFFAIMRPQRLNWRLNPILGLMMRRPSN